MKIAPIVAFAAVACSASLVAPGGTRELSDAELLEYASAPYDKAEMMNKRAILGTHHGAKVLAEFPCSDICPTYTVRVIHYDISSRETCAKAGGVMRPMRVPRGIASHDEGFCFPKVLSDNWSQYRQ